jgi:hypothetical protein
MVRDETLQCWHSPSLLIIFHLLHTWEKHLPILSLAVNEEKISYLLLTPGANVIEFFKAVSYELSLLSLTSLSSLE